ncbi:MAG: PaaI family thioesterase [Candidatus Binatia bacterium]
MIGDLTPRLAVTLRDRERLAAAVRRLTALLVTTDAPSDAYVAATVAVERAIETLAPHVASPPLPRFNAPGASSTPNDFFPFDPIMGRLSPLALPVELSWEEEKCIGRARFDTPYEGPPGCVHGGVIAGVFDQILAIPNIMMGTPGPTQRLALRYRRPTPLRTDLVFEGWRTSVDGKHAHARGRLLAAGEVTVEAEGTFVQVSLEQLMAMGRRR